MSVSYDVFTDAFLSKISEYDLIELTDKSRELTVDGYLKRAIAAFKKNCAYDLSSSRDDEHRMFNIDMPDGDLEEIADIISEGMVVQWLKPYVYKQELMENALTTRDFATFSPAELNKRVGSAYAKAQKDYIQMIREYSYNHGDLSDLHL